MERVELVIEGMGCEGCVQAVREALGKLPGVRRVEVDLAAGRARVEQEGVAAEALRAAVERAGYEVRAVEPTR